MIKKTIKPKTNWYVITGAPHSGKTSVIKLLEQKGYHVVYEAARIVIDKGIEEGLTLKEIRQDEDMFQKKVLDMKIDIENNLSQEDIIFFDRALPDTEAYNNLHGFDCSQELAKALRSCNYKKIFLFEPLPYKLDYARTENEEEQKKLQILLEESYSKLGIPIIKVPVMDSKQERMLFVMNNL
jgi:predicted ATPase